MPEHFAMALSAQEIRRMNFTAAVEAAGGVEPFCRRHEMNPDYVRQLIRGGDTASGRNIGNRAARTIEGKLGLPENALDHAGHQAPAAPEPANKTAAQRLEQDVSAMRYALAAIMTGLALTRPAEAKAVELALREAPERLLADGLLPELLGALANGRRAAARKPGGLPPKPKSPS